MLLHSRKCVGGKRGLVRAALLHGKFKRIHGLLPAVGRLTSFQRVLSQPSLLPVGACSFTAFGSASRSFGLCVSRENMSLLAQARTWV